MNRWLVLFLGLWSWTGSTVLPTPDRTWLPEGYVDPGWSESERQAILAPLSLSKIGFSQPRVEKWVEAIEKNLEEWRQPGLKEKPSAAFLYYATYHLFFPPESLNEKLFQTVSLIIPRLAREVGLFQTQLGMPKFLNMFLGAIGLPERQPVKGLAEEVVYFCEWRIALRK